MFIKISDNPERYVNTDQIELVSFGKRARAATGAGCILDLVSKRSLDISEATGRALLEFVEANASVLDEESGPSDSGYAQLFPPPLSSRIAQQLRDGAPNGMSVMDLVMHFEVSDKDLIEALDTLMAERVVILHDVPPLAKYFHAINAPGRIAPPDAEAAANG